MYRCFPFHYTATTVRPLKELCRFTISANLVYKDRLKLLKTLPLPQHLLRFVFATDGQHACRLAAGAQLDALVLFAATCSLLMLKWSHTMTQSCSQTQWEIQRPMISNRSLMTGAGVRISSTPDMTHLVTNFIR